MHFSVTALSRVVVLKLSKEFFDRNYRQLPGLEESIKLGYDLYLNDEMPFLDYEVNR